MTGGASPPSRLGDATFISLKGAGRYLITSQPGSSTITDVQESRTGYGSDYSASVRRDGGARVLRYDAGRKASARSVAFWAKGTDTDQLITTVSGGKGEVRFTPKPGSAGTRRIVAISILDGTPGATGYGILVRQTDGTQRRLRAASGRRSVKVAQVSSTAGGKVSVSARDRRIEWTKDSRAARYRRTRAPFSVVQTGLANERRDARRAREKHRG